MTARLTRTVVLSACVGTLLTAGWPMKALSEDTGTYQHRPTVCTEQYLPVCGRIGRITKTYSNACFARAAGAEVIAQGPCQTDPHAPGPYR